MASPTLVPIILTDVILIVEADNYEAHVSKVQFDPTTSIVKWKGLKPTSVFNFPTSSDWTLSLDYAQDWATADSLSNYLFDNEGEVKEVTFKPKSAGVGTAPTWTANVIITPGAIGGPVDTVAVGTVTLGLQGKPVRSVE